MKNGLYKEVIEKKYPDGEDMADEIYTWIDSREALDGPTLDQELILLAGSGVSHFDRRWAKKFLPDLENIWTHFAIDVGVMRRMLEMHAPQLAARARHLSARGVTGPAHRALNCNRLSIQAYQYYVDLIRDLNNQDFNRREMASTMQMMVDAGAPVDREFAGITGESVQQSATAPPTADVQQRQQHQPGARASRRVCGYMGPGDVCTFEPHIEGRHSWE